MAYQPNLESDCGSISDMLEIFRQFKTNPNKDLSSLSFSIDSSDNPQHPNIIHPLTEQSSLITNQSKEAKKIIAPNLKNKNCTFSTNTKNSVSFGNHSNVFQKLYHQKRELDQRKCRLQYESKKSKEEKEQEQCTFSPNICLSRKLMNSKSPTRIRTEFDSVEQNDQFYNRNMEWVERKQRNIKKMQCQKNQENVSELTFTPRINRQKTAYNRKCEDKQNQKNKTTQNKGVQDFLGRQKKAKALQQEIKYKKKNPYSHIWTVKKGHFSYVK